MSIIVLIDSGNTRLKVGIADIARVDSLERRGMRTTAGQAGEAGSIPESRRAVRMVHNLDNNDVQGLKDWLGSLPAAPTAALGTNVAGAARGAGIESALAALGCPMRWIVPQAQAYGLASRYARPEQLGADRWVSMLGVLAESLSPAASSAARPSFLLASFGTATTLDTVSSQGVFEGGLILPGPALMRQSLASGTANLPLAQGIPQDFPTDTHGAISSGVAAAQAGAVVRQWLAGARHYGEPPRVYASGGGWTEVEAETRRLLADAAAAMGRLPPQVAVIENPVLKGLAYIAGLDHQGSP
jgi:type III pantothenate kinase